MQDSRLIDTHAHLLDPAFDADRADALARAQTAGVGLVVEIADSPETWEPVLALARSRGLRCALGLHPYSADRYEPSLAGRLLRCAEDPVVVAAGEIGLDYAKCPHPRDLQKAAFLGMLEAADAAALPVVVHSRDAFPDTLDILEAFYRDRPARGRLRGVLHCFSGGRTEALRGAALGFALGVDGPVTYPKNEPLRDAFRAVGLAALVLETDCPYLPPQSSRGRRNEPAFLPEIARGLAAALATTEAAVAEATNANARELFRLGRP
ncbi:MAG: TatD family hydrolase [Elusimicrobiota bacterium]